MSSIEQQRDYGLPPDTDIFLPRRLSEHRGDQAITEVISHVKKIVPQSVEVSLVSIPPSTSLSQHDYITKLIIRPGTYIDFITTWSAK